ncbi:MAG: MFS transporter, partial [Bacteroidota bacterium]
RIGIILCACAFFSLLLPGNGKTITLIMILFITIGEIMTMPFMTSFWIKRTNENNRGQYAAIFTIAWGTGQTLGPYLCSKLVEQTNFQVLFIVLGSILLLTAFGFSRLKSN